MATRRIIVKGRVQGVFYRNWTIDTANELGLTGWVRNRLDGDVEILAMGREAAIQSLIERCRDGPPAARVIDVIVSEAEPEEVSGFERRQTV